MSSYTGAVQVCGQGKTCTWRDCQAGESGRIREGMARLQSKSRAGLDKDGLAKNLEFLVEVGGMDFDR